MSKHEEVVEPVVTYADDYDIHPKVPAGLPIVAKVVTPKSAGDDVKTSDKAKTK